MAEAPADDYGLSKVAAAQLIAAPALPYQPRNPQSYAPAIGLIGCGGIAAQHLNAYRQAGYRVAALCDRTESKARALQAKFYPAAFVTTDYRELLARSELEVVDIATHAEDRAPLIAAALDAGKHVLSQKPFVVDLDVGERLVELAERRNLKLAVNQNGRWAPHFSYIGCAIQAGLLGEIESVNFTLHWDHNWIIGTPFERIEQLVLYDFGIHWFDLAAHFFGARRPQRVYAAATRAVGQRAQPPLLAQALIEFADGQASLSFNANVAHGQEDRTFIAGTQGSITSVGPSLSEQTVTLHTAASRAQPQLDGTWFGAGFHGAMAELLCAIEDDREPSHGARANLRSLELCFAALASATEGVPKTPGDARRLCRHER